MCCTETDVRTTPDGSGMVGRTKRHILDDRSLAKDKIETNIIPRHC